MQLELSLPFFRLYCRACPGQMQVETVKNCDHSFPQHENGSGLGRGDGDMKTHVKSGAVPVVPSPLQHGYIGLFSAVDFRPAEADRRRQHTHAQYCTLTQSFVLPWPESGQRTVPCLTCLYYITKQSHGLTRGTVLRVQQTASGCSEAVHDSLADAGQLIRRR